MNFDFKNGYKNEFQDNNEKSRSCFKNRVSKIMDFIAVRTHESHPKAWELKIAGINKLNMFTLKIESRVEPDILGRDKISCQEFFRHVFDFTLYSKR